MCGPVLFIWTLIRGDMKMAINFPYLFSPGFIVCSAAIRFFPHLILWCRSPFFVGQMNIYNAFFES